MIRLNAPTKYEGRCGVWQVTGILQWNESRRTRISNAHSTATNASVKSDLYALLENYQAINERFHSTSRLGNRASSIDNAWYHKGRYIDILRRNFTGSVFDVGNDKPFLFFLRAFNPMAEFTAISFEKASKI